MEPKAVSTTFWTSCMSLASSIASFPTMTIPAILSPKPNDPSKFPILCCSSLTAVFTFLDGLNKLAILCFSLFTTRSIFLKDLSAKLPISINPSAAASAISSNPSAAASCLSRISCNRRLFISMSVSTRLSCSVVLWYSSVSRPSLNALPV